MIHGPMPSLLSFPNQKTRYLTGAFWAIMICVCSVMNDVIMRFVGGRLHAIEISFFRFFFSMITVVPLMLLKSRNKTHFFKTKAIKAHLSRGILGAVAIALCCFSVNIMPLSENTAIMFTQPLFFLPLATFFLKEKVDKPRWIATIIGFLGLLFIIHPGKNVFQIEALIPTFAAILFAFSDVLNKKMVVKENKLTMMFYFGLITTLISSFFLESVWQTPTFQEVFLLILLGCGANLIQLCIFKSFASADASSLMPFRYVEFPISALAGFLMFGQIPGVALIVGATIISGSSFYITYKETKKEKSKNNVYNLQNKSKKVKNNF
jgi:S-adenosylmethionine uptake transporter